jgi:lipopolysaccharide biosynthesis regulator YciM
MQDISVYFFLLIAVIAGWALGRSRLSLLRKAESKTSNLFQDYFVGLNYLLNDEPDEAIDTFIKALEINGDTVETHLALGALLRRRGKVDKAIKVHQALLARPGLDQTFAASSRLELARDYISAGLLDRAERLLNELLDENTPAKWDALKHLITIYQTEKEWTKAIDCSKELLANSSFKKDLKLRGAAAHFCCEQAELALSENQLNQARALTKRAFTFNRHSVRASFLLAKIEQGLGNFRSAIKELIRIKTNNPEFVSRLLEPLSQCYEQLGKIEEYEQLLQNSLQERSDVNVMLALAELIRARENDAATIDFLSREMAAHPSLKGLVALMDLKAPDTDAQFGNNLQLLQQLIHGLLTKKAAYQCSQCGYESKSPNWLCPSCHSWDREKPILGAETE